MILNTTYKSKENSNKISDLVGASFSLLDRLKIKGIGSPKLIAVSASKDIWDLLERTNNTNHINIELRPKGIIVRFKSGYEDYVWAIPFYLLTIFQNGKAWSVFDKSQKMNLEYAFVSDEGSKFVRQILEAKSKYLANQDFYEVS